MATSVFGLVDLVNRLSKNHVQMDAASCLSHKDGIHSLFNLVIGENGICINNTCFSWSLVFPGCWAVLRFSACMLGSVKSGWILSSLQDPGPSLLGLLKYSLHICHLHRWPLCLQKVRGAEDVGFPGLLLGSLLSGLWLS